jgi:ElaB/YqjD/DUF883 family membrane-anchored ribosome-binding protein
MIEPIPTTSSTRDKLMDDLRSVITDAEAWLKNGSMLSGEDLAAAKAKFESTIRSAKEDLVRLEQTVVAKTKEAARATDEYVHEHPWKAVGLGAAVGVVIGMLIARK